MLNSGKKKRNPSAVPTDADDGVDPSLKLILNVMKSDLMDTARDALGRLETRIERNEASIATLEKRVE